MSLPSFRFFFGSVFAADMLTLLERQNIKEGIDGHAVDWYDEVFDIVFPNVNMEDINSRWKEALEGKEKDSTGKDQNGKNDDDDWAELQRRSLLVDTQTSPLSWGIGITYGHSALDFGMTLPCGIQNDGGIRNGNMHRCIDRGFRYWRSFEPMYLHSTNSI